MANLCFASISFPSVPSPPSYDFSSLLVVAGIAHSSSFAALLSFRRRRRCRLPQLARNALASACVVSILRRLLLACLACSSSFALPSAFAVVGIHDEHRCTPSPPILFRPRHRSKRAHWPSSPPQIAFVVVVVDIHEEQGRALGPHAHVVSHPLPSSSLEELARSSVAILSLRRRYARSAEVRRRRARESWSLLISSPRNAVAGSCSRVFPLSVVVIVAQGFDVVPHPLHLLRRPEALASSRIVDSMQSASLIRRDDDGWGPGGDVRAGNATGCGSHHAMGLRGWMTRDDLCIVGMIVGPWALGLDVGRVAAKLCASHGMIASSCAAKHVSQPRPSSKTLTLQVWRA
ncbi:hypothetical protein DFP72DRAFT_1146435 [Ephemerocybe angulata]|uniref:Uncharacterized protein n=1 Tax=Ephemerocybe angulata TaxID=980116 RepID=A0A8H6HM03_9AGAR|nr:hypothetical protein DFP72DRAFT_1146435 [Tulosesus angulatus]